MSEQNKVTEENIDAPTFPPEVFSTRHPILGLSFGILIFAFGMLGVSNFLHSLPVTFINPRAGLWESFGVSFGVSPYSFANAILKSFGVLIIVFASMLAMCYIYPAAKTLVGGSKYPVHFGLISSLLLICICGLPTISVAKSYIEISSSDHSNSKNLAQIEKIEDQTNPKDATSQSSLETIMKRDGFVLCTTERPGVITSINGQTGEVSYAPGNSGNKDSKYPAVHLLTKEQFDSGQLCDDGYHVDYSYINDRSQGND